MKLPFIHNECKSFRQVISDAPPSSTPHVVTVIGGGVAVVFGCMAILGWVTGLPITASMRLTYTPMASSTACVFVLLGSLSIIHGRKPLLGRSRNVASILILTVSILICRSLAGDATSAWTNSNGRLLPTHEMVESFPINRMSPITGLFFILSSVSFLLLLWFRNKTVRNVTATLTAVSLTGGLIGGMGYLYGAPTLYGHHIIPMAVTTVIALLFLNVALLSMAGSDCYLTQPWMGSSVRAVLLRSFVPLTMLMLIAEEYSEQTFYNLLPSVLRPMTSALSSLIFTTIAGIAAYQVAHMIGDAIDTAETKRAKAEKQLHYQSNHESLTGLPNRYRFEQCLTECIAEGGTKPSLLTVLFLDLDKFKIINDTLGHRVGDLLLIEVTSRLKSCLRSQDLLSRMGGDEFTMILSHCHGRSDPEAVAARIIDQISRPFDIDGHRFVVGASIGLSRCPSDGTDASTLLKHADAAMYKAKRAGGGTYCWYTGDADKDNQSRMEIEMDLHTALDNGQIKVYYQPIISLKDDRLSGAEALLRWDHPEKGMISPSLFIPIAEDIHLIGSIGDFVLRTACGQARAWHDEGINVPLMSVNISAAQLHDPKWLDSTKSALSESRLDPRFLNLELTETDFASDYESLRETLRRVRRLGIGVAIDDFGTGHSSLSRLKDFPAIHLKIDGSFVRNIEHNESDKALLQSIIGMAESQGMDVTAEWVETVAQMEILRSSGCDFAQGYLISPPLPAEEFQRFALERASKEYGLLVA